MIADGSERVEVACERRCEMIAAGGQILVGSGQCVAVHANRAERVVCKAAALRAPSPLSFGTSLFIAILLCWNLDI